MCNSKGRKLFLLVFDSAFKLFQLCVAPWVANVVCVNLEELDCECVNAGWHLFMHRVVTIIILKGFCSWDNYCFNLHNQYMQTSIFRFVQLTSRPYTQFFIWPQLLKRWILLLTG